MHKINTEKIFIWFLFSLTIIISLAPFFKIGITNSDDLENYMSLSRHRLFSDAWMYAKSAGRFYFIITKPLYSLPYIGDNFLLTKIIQNFSLLLSYSLFSILIKKIFKSKELALALFLLLVMATPASENCFLPFIGFPFYFTFSFSILIGSFLLFIKYTETEKYKYVIFSAIVLFIAILFYETYLVFALFLCFFILYRNLSSLKSLRALFRNKVFYKELVPIISAVIVYILLYFVFRKIFPSEMELYDGSSFVKNFSFTNYFILTMKLIKTILPTNLYFLSQEFIIQNSLSPAGHINCFWYILKNTPLLLYINTVIQMFLFVLIALRFNKRITYKQIFLGILVAFLFAISAHSILGISEKYNAVEYKSIIGYVTSYYSYFGVWLIILLLSYLMIKITRKIKYVKYAVIVVLALGLGYVSIITTYTNDHLSRGWEKSQLRFTLLDALFEEGAFDNVNNGSIIYSPELYVSDPLGRVIVAGGFNWADYMRVKFQKDIHMAENPDDLKLLIDQIPDANVYRFIKNNTEKNTNFMFVIAEINKSTIDFESGINLFMNATCNKADIHYYSPTKDFTFIFYPKDSENKNAIVNDYDFIKLEHGYNHIRINNTDKNKMISSFSLESEVEMFSELFSITNMISEYTQIINIVDNSKVLFSYYNAIDSSIVVESSDVFPLGFIPTVSLNSSHSIISLAVNLEISNLQKGQMIQIVVDVEDENNEIVFWDSKIYHDITKITFNQIVDLRGMQERKPYILKFFLWNPDGCSFTINSVNTISVKII